MTITEKMNRVEELRNDSFITYKTAEELQGLLKEIKISDFFRWLHDVKNQSRCEVDYFYKMMGFTVKGGVLRLNEKLEAAKQGGYVEICYERKYSRNYKYLRLTKKGTMLVFPRG